MQNAPMAPDPEVATLGKQYAGQGAGMLKAVELQQAVKDGEKFANRWLRVVLFAELTVMLVGIPGLLVGNGLAILHKIQSGEFTAQEIFLSEFWLVEIAITFMQVQMVVALFAVPATHTKVVGYACISLIFFQPFCGGPFCYFFHPFFVTDWSTVLINICMAWCPLGGFWLINGLFYQPPTVTLRMMQQAVAFFFTTVMVLGAAVIVQLKDLAATGELQGSEFEVARLLATSIAWYPVTAIIAVACVSSRAKVAFRRAFIRLYSKLDAGFDYSKFATGSTIAAMIGPGSYCRHFEESMALLHCVSMADITREEIFEKTPNPKCFDKATPAEFNEIDFFLSHSWSDDPESKWLAMQELRAEFIAQHGREPKVWLDKYCIDQTDIQNQVKRLPFSVIASQKFCILLGPSYVTRAWCLLELFMFLSAREAGIFKDDDVSIKNLDELGRTSFIKDFDSANAMCYVEGDRQRIFATIDSAADGKTGFDMVVHSFADELNRGEESPMSRRVSRLKRMHTIGTHSTGDSATSLPEFSEYSAASDRSMWSERSERSERSPAACGASASAPTAAPPPTTAPAPPSLTPARSARATRVGFSEML